jgi:glycosyltransferase involved in cell wall biosynthesis
MRSLITEVFSPDWYLSENPDVQSFPNGPQAHYLTFGWREGRSPHPLFDTSWYLQQAPDLALQGLEPTTDYCNMGWREMRSPHPLFNPSWYLLQNPDVMAANIDPWWHYLQKGWREGRTLHPLFDTNWYLAENPDVAKAGLEPLSHYLQMGWREGRNPHPVFDGAWYRDQYGVQTNPWLDYITTGWREGRNPHPKFDAQWYQDAYLDPAAQLCEPLAHYLSAGWEENLLPHKGFQLDPQPGKKTAPLYDQLNTAPVLRAANNLRTNGSRGRLILVTHDAQLGGAQRVLKLFADWVQSSTRFSVGIVAVKGGPFLAEFEEIAPVFVLSDHAEADRAAAMNAWAHEGADAGIKGIFVNSIASGSFYKYWTDDTPSVAFIHELEKILEMYPDEVALLKEHTDHVVCGGPDVLTALRDVHGIAPERLTAAHSFVEALPADDTEADRTARRAAARTAMGIPPERILVMGCGVAHWRKSPDKFVETAARVLASGVDAQFVWLGGGPDVDDCIAQATAAGIQDRVTFAGYEPDVAGKLAGADVFLLSSQEDPFPLVMIYAAQAGVPVVCFKDAGGAEHFVRDGSGVSVPFMDIPAMADAVTRYARDPALRTQVGEIGMKQVATKHTINVVAPLLLHHLREVAGMTPEVSVVLPNYNYEDYLPERLDSITAQEFQDFEIILLDDASPDNSAKLLTDFAATRPGTQVKLNTENSGSPFKQWMLGMDMAKSDIIWLAEADDYCEPDLLTTLLPMFDDRNMRMASCMSVPVRADGSVIGDYRPIYLDRIAPGRFDNDYIVTDNEEANHGLGIANTIPNASGVMFRRFDAEPEFIEKVTNMRLCGDWFFYTRAMKGGLVGFSTAPLNYHRRHTETVTHKLEGSLRYFEELADVRAYLGRTYVQGPAARTQIQAFLDQDVARFNVTDPAALAQAPEPAKSLPTLLVVAPDLSPGGGQMFAISLANEWAARGGRAVLFNVASQPTHPAVLAKLDIGVAYYENGGPGAYLDEIVTRHDVDIIHSSIWWADAMVDSYREKLPADIPWIISMHGCHETFIKHPEIDGTFPERMNRMLTRASAWVYTAEKNLAIFDTYPRPETLLRIPNGMRAEPVGTVLERSALGLREDAVVMCLASRAIPSKGWGEAIALTQSLNAQGHKVDLMLIGEGPSADAARAAAPDNVHLMGQVSNLQDYFSVADIGLLPSYFVGESLPLVLIEMMAKGLPLIATDIGEIADILGTGPQAAGILVPLKGEGLDTDDFAQAARRMLDASVREAFGGHAQARFDAQFKLDRMVNRYAALYSDVGASRWKNNTVLSEGSNDT